MLINYVYSESPDDRVLARASDAMKSGGLICFPTDTNWVLGACPNSKAGVDLLYRVKGAQKEKHFSLFCSSISEASKFCIIPDSAYKRINRRVPGPYTFIFEPTKSIPTAIKNYRKEKQIGVRFPKATICQRLVEIHGMPVIASSVTRDMLDKSGGGDEDIFSYEIEDILGHQLKMIIDPGEYHLVGSSSVVDFSNDDGVPVIIREGAGDLTLFIQ